LNWEGKIKGGGGGDAIRVSLTRRQSIPAEAERTMVQKKRSHAVGLKRGKALENLEDT